MNSRTHWNCFLWQLLFHVDNGAGRITAEHTPDGEGFCDGRWHTVVARKLRHRVELVVDGEESQAESPNARSNTCDTNDPIYVGGYPGTSAASLTFIQREITHIHINLHFGLLGVCISTRVSVFSLSWSSSGGSLYQHILQRLSEEPENHQGFEDHGRALQQGSGDQRSAASLLSCCLTFATKPATFRISVFQCNFHTSSFINLFEGA